MTGSYSNNGAAQFERGEGYLDQIVSDLSHDPEFVSDGLALALAEDIAKAMKDSGVSNAELARRMEVSRSYVTRILDAPPNLTLMSISKVALALGLKPEVRLRNPRRLSRFDRSFTVIDSPMTKEARHDKPSPETAQLLSRAA